MLQDSAAGRGRRVTQGCVVSALTTVSRWQWRMVNSCGAAAMTADAFVAQAAAQQMAVGTTTAVRRLSVGDVQTNPAGLSFLVATYAITQQRSDGSSVTSAYDAYFVLQGDSWKLWFTARRS